MSYAACSLHLSTRLEPTRSEEDNPWMVSKLKEKVSLHKTKVSSACGYELYFLCAFCSLGVSATRWTQSLVAPSKRTPDHSVHDDYV